MSAFANVDEAIAFLRKDSHPDKVRADYPDAARYLGESGDEHALQPLLEALTHHNPWIRSTAAIGLGYLGKKEAIPHLVEAFSYDSGLYVRCDAALALGRLVAEESIPIMLERFPKEQFEVQKRIIWALGEMNTQQSRDALAQIRDLLMTFDTADEGTEFLMSQVTEELERDANSR